MKQLIYTSLLVMIVVCLTSALSKQSSLIRDPLTGAWQLSKGYEEHVLLFVDGYVTYTAYDKAGKRFLGTSGGTYTVNGKSLSLICEFDTKLTERVGKTFSFPFSINQKGLETNFSRNSEVWTKLDDAGSGLAGLWTITARKQEGGLVPIHQSGTRKTVKILTGTRFQWAAIDPGTKEFMGTGGGTYRFMDGKYTEQIEFFSRDSSRVGKALTFNGKLENGHWHHSGLSSRGDSIYEVWSRKQ